VPTIEPSAGWLLLGNRALHPTGLDQIGLACGQQECDSLQVQVGHPEIKGGFLPEVWLFGKIENRLKETRQSVAWKTDQPLREGGSQSPVILTAIRHWRIMEIEWS